MQTRFQQEQPARPVETEELLRIIRPKRKDPATQDRVLIWRDDRRSFDRVLRWDGPCIGCGVQTWAFDDGENDPRGVLGDAAMFGVPIPSREGEPEDDLEARACALCANEESSYRRIHDTAVRNFARSLPYQWGRSILLD